MSNSFLINMDTTAIIPPKERLPVSPIKTCAGNELYHKKPTHDPTKADIKITTSPISGMYIIFK